MDYTKNVCRIRRKADAAFFMELVDTSEDDKLKDRAKRKRDRELSDIRFVLKSVEGRRFYWRLLAEGKLWQVDFNGDVNWLVFATGEKNFSAKFMKDILEAKPDAFLQMQQEYASEIEREKSTDNKSASD